MSFTKEEVQKLAKLSRLHLSENEIEDMKEKLGSILEYVQKLKDVDTENVPELQHTSILENILREDVALCDPIQSKKARELFSAKENDLLSVQAVFESRNE